MDSILTSIKKLLGIDETYMHFDDDLIIQINSAFSTLSQLGVGPKDGFSISDSTDSWDSLLMDKKLLNFVKTYVQLKVKMVFDPPLGSAVTDSYNQQIKELEWRIQVAADSDSEDKEEDDGK